MHFFLLSPLIASISNLLLSVFVLTRDIRSKTNRIFFYWGLALTVWTFGAFLLFRVQDHDSALLVARMLHMGVIFLPVLFTHLAVLVTGIPMRKVLPWAYAATIFLAVSDLTPFFIKDVRYVGFAYYAVAGPFYWGLSNMVSLLGISSVYFMLKKRRQLGALQKRRVSAMIYALVLLMVLGLHDLMPVLEVYYYPGTLVPVYPLGTLAAFLFPVIVSYSVLQNQLLDMRFRLSRVSAMLVRNAFHFCVGFALLFVCALLAPHDFPLYAFISGLVVLIVTGLFSSIFFPKLLGAGTESLERKILGDRFEYQEQIRGFIDSLHFYSQTDKLLDDLESLLLKTIKVGSYRIAFLDFKSSQLFVSRSYPTSSEEFKFPADSPVIKFFRAGKKAYLDFRSLRFDRNDNGIEHQARNQLCATQGMDPELCFPLHSEHNPFGILMLGKKQADLPYTSQDFELLAELAVNLSVFFDRIRLKEQVALTEQLESLAVMSRGLAHDLNNLLTPINTYLQIEATELSLGSPKIELHRIATKNMQTIRSYVREAVFFSTTLSPNIRLVSVEQLLASTAAICQLQLEKRDIHLTCELPVPFEFHGDDVLLQRMLANFIFNAIDASPSGSIIKLRALLLPDTGHSPAWIRFQVVDQGSGISKENINRIFTPYFSTKDLGDQTRGFGLGLTICQKIAHLHQGTISLQSTLGKGTTLQVDLPRQPETTTAASSRLT